MFFVPPAARPDERAVEKKVVRAGSGRDFRAKHLLTFLDASYFLFVRRGLFFFRQSRRRFCAGCASANSCRFQWAVINNINHEPLFMATTTTATRDYFVRLFRTLKFQKRNLGLMDGSGFRECSGNEASSHPKHCHATIPALLFYKTENIDEM